MNHTRNGPNMRTTRGLMFVGVAIAGFLLVPSTVHAMYRDGMNLYQYVRANPIRLVDPSGLWGGGLHGGQGDVGSRGHSDFAGSIDTGGPFDYNIEDTGDTRPEKWGSTWRHFRKLDEAERDLAAAVRDCDLDGFQRHAHQMQDFFSHRGQGYVAHGGSSGWGHGGGTVSSEYRRLWGFDDARPDNARDYEEAYDAASQRTRVWFERWDSCCCKAMQSVMHVFWNPSIGPTGGWDFYFSNDPVGPWGKRSGRDEKMCAERPPIPEDAGYTDEKAPPPTPEPIDAFHKRAWRKAKSWF